ncbi:MAG: von Willebrand factor type A domain-containing protein [Verrucomicrobiota bacterium]
MKILVDDPRLTAYALGEIEDDAERAEIEQAIAESPELQQVVEETKKLSTILSEGFAQEPTPELSEFEKAKLETKVEKKKPALALLISWPVVTGIAAVFVMALVLIPGAKKQSDMSYVEEEEPLPVELETESEGTKAIRLRPLEVTIPDERIEGTPMPIKVPGLEPAPSAAPVILLEESEAIPGEIMGDDASEIQIADNETIEGGTVGNASNFSAAPSQSRLEAPTAYGFSKRSEPRQKMSVVREDAFAIDSQDISRGFAANLIQDEVSKENPTWNTESYDTIEETDFRSPLVAPLSTFSIDVDTASYANVRRFLDQGSLPPFDAVRIEELINYFPYADAAPLESPLEGGDPFAVHMAQTSAPWNAEHRLLRIALKGYEMPWAERPASNLVFLLDVSGSMNSPNKLPLVKNAMELLTRRLDERDRVAIVVYAGASGLVLPSTTANNIETIQYAINNLEAGGSTNAGAGIELAYKTARKHFIEGGNNRVILCTDGDFNIGQTNRGELAEIAETEAEEGVSLTILGFGMGNLKDGMLEALSNKGKGSYAYIDSEAEARKVFLEDLASNIFKIAKDVKIQVEFNPARVSAYRLIGYENRLLKAEDFNNDKKKAGDIGPGHSIVALYELVPPAAEMEIAVVDPLRYQETPEVERSKDEVATVKLRYKQPNGSVSKLISRAALEDDIEALEETTDDVRFSAAVAAFGLRLRKSDTVGAFSYPEIERLAASALGKDPGGHRSEFLDLVRKAEKLTQD